MSARADATRVVLPDGTGPVLVDGPVELVLPDGTTVRSERPVVALCTCRRSHRYPFCDTSHRRRRRGPGTADPGTTPSSADSPTDHDADAGSVRQGNPQ